MALLAVLVAAVSAGVNLYGYMHVTDMALANRNGEPLRVDVNDESHPLVVNNNCPSDKDLQEHKATDDLPITLDWDRSFTVGRVKAKVTYVNAKTQTGTNAGIVFRGAAGTRDAQDAMQGDQRIPPEGQCGTYWRWATQQAGDVTTAYFEGIWPAQVYCFGIYPTNDQEPKKGSDGIVWACAQAPES